MKQLDHLPLRNSGTLTQASREQGFTLVETSIAMVIMMVISLAAASLFAYATTSNSDSTDRELAMAVAQKRLEWLRNMPFSTQTRNLAYSYPNGGLAATSSTGTVETETSSGRTYAIVTKIENIAFVPMGEPDEGQPIVKTITITVTPVVSGTSSLGSVTLVTQRTSLVPGIY